LSEHGETIRQVDRTGRFIQGAAEDPAGAISDLALDIASDEAYSVARDNITQAAEEAVQFYVAICNDPETPEPVRLAAIAAGSMASLATEENFDTTHQVLTLGLTANDFIESGDSDRRIVNRRRRPQNNSNDIPESSYCSFVAGTKVLTPEGDRNIEEIKVGDWVIADDPHTPGGIEKRQVMHTFVHESTSLVDVYVGAEKITTDDEHEFWVKDLGWVAAKDLKEGMQLQTNDERFVGVDRIQRKEEVQQVYNFEVEGFHTYFVSDLGILVHNTCTGKPNVTPGYETDSFRGTWEPSGEDSRNPTVMGHRAPNGGVSISDIYRRGNPPGTGGEMVADTIRGAGISSPTYMRVTNIGEGTNFPTYDAVTSGRGPQGTPLGDTVENAIKSLGGRPTGNWEFGEMRGGVWIQRRIEY
jgi:hypothetical protein